MYSLFIILLSVAFILETYIVEQDFTEDTEEYSASTLVLATRPPLETQKPVENTDTSTDAPTENITDTALSDTGTETDRVTDNTADSEDVTSESATVVTTDVPVVTPEEDGVVGSYADGNIQITVREIRYEGTTAFVADIQINSLAYLKTAIAKDTFGKNIKEKTSEMAKRKGAILAVNGDYYGANDSGYVIKNGVMYR